jgi:tRNA pseudouridine13 synthase
LDSVIEVRVYEEKIIKEYASWYEGLRKNRVQVATRNCQAQAHELAWEWISEPSKLNLKLSFRLDSGCFATSLLRELVQINDKTDKKA